MYNDVGIEDTISKFTVTLTRLESHVALSELKVFAGRATSSFQAANLKQDSSRTWLVFNEPGLTTFEVDELDVRGNAHLAIQNGAGSVAFKVKDYKGDFTGTIHIGRQQEFYLDASNKSVIPFTLRTYQVGTYIPDAFLLFPLLRVSAPFPNLVCITYFCIYVSGTLYVLVFIDT